MGAAVEDKIVEMIPQKTAAGIQVFFKGLGGLADAPLKPFPTELEKGLFDLLRTELEVIAGKQEIVVTIGEGIERD